MKQSDAAWLAGLFDGEGSIILSGRQRAGGGTLRITISNTFMPLLDRVLAVTGVGTIIRHASINPRHADSLTWQVYGESAKHLLRQMKPWLIVKADRLLAVEESRVFERGRRWA